MELLKDKILFWEADLSTLDAEKHKQYIIERVFERGSWNDYKQVLQYYPLVEIKKALQNARWLDAKTMYFVSAYFNLPLEQMRCYIQRQLSPQPWV
jgi:hypothetical protein